MKNWLEKYSEGGEVNYNTSKVVIPPNFVGEGYNSSNWKSPAWGGSFKNGGEIMNVFRTGDAIAEDGIELKQLQDFTNNPNWLEKYK